MVDGRVVAEHAVVVAGGGPTGLVLACELVLAGADVLVVERRPSQDLEGTRAGGLHARTLEVLDQRGVVERFLAEGTVVQTHGFGGMLLDISDIPTRHPYGLALWQRDFERILAGWADELGVRVLREREVVGLAQDGDGVTVDLSDGSALRCRYLVGCDGGRSVVRKAAGIDFPGWDPSTSWIIAQAEMAEQPEIGMRPEGGGIGPVDRFGGTGGPYGAVLKEPWVEGAGTPDLEDVRAALVRIYGTDFGIHSPTWISRFDDASRQAERYRAGRVLLAGDAAHIHGPQAGQGLNTGVQDAVNLGWKLAQVVAGTSPESLLDTYHDERHPVAARVLQNTMAQVALAEAGPRHQALRDILAGLVGLDQVRRHLAGMISALDVAYEVAGGGDHPLVGRRVPDLDLRTPTGTTRVYELLHDARPLLLHLDGPGGFDVTPWSAARVRLVEAEAGGSWALPVIGEVPAPAAVLVRPDGHVAWTGELTDPTLPAALTRWFGPPT